MSRRDEALFLDMLLACKRILKFTAGMNKGQFDESDLVQSAVIREFQVVGEAVRMISEDARKRYDDLSWHKISGMRNKVVHEYFNIQLDIVWDTIRDDILPLVARLEEIVSEFDEE